MTLQERLEQWGRWVNTVPISDSAHYLPNAYKLIGPKYFYFGCGKEYNQLRFQKGWSLCDINPVSDKVAKYDILLGFPQTNNSLHVVKCSKLLEYFTLEQGGFIFSEVYRTLVVGGKFELTIMPWSNWSEIFSINNYFYGDQKDIWDFKKSMWSEELLTKLRVATKLQVIEKKDKHLDSPEITFVLEKI